MTKLTTSLKQVLQTTSSHLKKLELLGIKNMQELLLFFPRGYQDKSQISKIAQVKINENNNISGTLKNVYQMKTRTGKYMTRAILYDETSQIELVWFNQPYLKQVLKNGLKIIVSGKVKFGFNKFSIQNPAFEEIKKEQVHTGRIIPIYHQTDGITSKWLRDKIKPIIKDWLKFFHEYLPEDVIQRNNFVSYQSAIQEVHFPTSEKSLDEAKKRLAFDELFLLQLKAIQKKWFWQNITAHEKKVIGKHKKIGEFMLTLPFALTNAQQKSLIQILEDLEKPYPMSRLLQGDVGSGKTIVAGIAILNTILNGYQSTLMAPTEILAKQHFLTLFNLLKPFSLNIQFLSGSTPESIKEKIYKDISLGLVDLVIGTHAIIQEDVFFKKLGLAVIDEQHRFGVKQREILKKQGSPHLLNLSATPIPRTLAMTIYGDQDLSIIDEMPKGRKEIITRVVPENKRQDAYRWIESEIQKGRQAFVICPLIEESDVLEVKSAIQEFLYLQEHIFPTLKLGLLHGKMKPQEKEEVMSLFSQNKINILVSTSVIEVGIDVPNANIMIIEGSERFGLSQLHQFRGRVGRGEHQSYCFLFSKSNSSENSTRLQSMVKYSSGFKLSEIDLSLRGAGEIYGVKQSGIPDLKMASLGDKETLDLARNEAQKIIEKDPTLQKHPALKQKIEELTEVYVND